jgi:hypothetical protein
MITRSPLHQRPRHALPAGQRRSPVAGPRHKGIFLRCGGVRCPGPGQAGSSEEGNTQSNNYWSSSTIATNPNNAWIVNFNNGNVNNNNKTNNNYVRAVRGGL